MSDRRPVPRGRDSVRAAILNAAVQFASDGRRVSVRELARRANVNHGQVHHLFAGRDGLHRALLEHLATALYRRIESHEGPQVLRAALAAVLDDPRFVRVLADYLIENPEAEVPQESFPVMGRLAEVRNESGQLPTRVALATHVSAGLGWAMFNKWIRAALRLTDEEAREVEHRITNSKEQL